MMLHFSKKRLTSNTNNSIGKKALFQPFIDPMRLGLDGLKVSKIDTLASRIARMSIILVPAIV